MEREPEQSASNAPDTPNSFSQASRTTATRPGLVLAVMCAGMFLVLLDVTVVNVAVPAITVGLHTTTAGVQWVIDGYTVALASLLLAGGTLGDLFGHRKVVLCGLILFGIASLGCALAPTTSALMASRVVQGIGAALLLPGSVAAIADAFPEQAEKAKALGVWAAASALALPAGPLLGGFLVQFYGWRSIFWINPPMVVVCCIGVLVWVKALPRSAVEGTSTLLRREGRERRRRYFGELSAPHFDLGGLLAGTLSLAFLVYAVIAAGEDTTAALGAAALGALAVAGFLVVERRVANPLLPPNVWRVPEFWFANGSALVLNLTTNGLMFLLTRYLQQIQDHTALQAGLMLLPLFIPLAALSVLAGRLAARFGLRPIICGAALITAAGQFSLILVSQQASYLLLLPALVGVGVGIALFTAPVATMAIRALPPGQSGLASGVYNTSRQAGTALGVALFGAVAGNPADSRHFVLSMHGLGIGAALLCVVIAAQAFCRDHH